MTPRVRSHLESSHRAATMSHERGSLIPVIIAATIAVAAVIALILLLVQALTI